MNVGRHLCALTVFGALAAAPAAPAAAQDPSGVTTQVVTVERPIGQVGISVSTDAEGHLDLTVIDTRSDDPGWTVVVTDPPLRWRPGGMTQTPAFSDSTGQRYEQRASLNLSATTANGSATLASAPAHHGLGIVHLTVDLTPTSAPRGAAGKVTVTVI